MSSSSPVSAASTVDLTTTLVVAYVANNSVPAAELPALISRVHGAVTDLAAGSRSPDAAAVERAAVDKPGAAQVRKSVRHEGIVSFIDGKVYKTLKRHLSAHGLHPQSYRERYGLPADYPMVAPGYAERRSALAREIGLGLPGAERRGRDAA